MDTNTNMNIVLRPFTTLMIFAVLVLCSVSSIGQQVDRSFPPAPKSEKFEKIDELAVPWRLTGCGAEPAPCHNVTGVEFDQTSQLSLFNSDGTLWYRFSVSFWETGHFDKVRNSSFVPFSTMGDSKPQYIVILRLTGISDDWYEVEINEKTQQTKYISKKDASWAKVSWGYWLRSDPRIVIDENKTPLFDGPNGKQIDSKGIGAYTFLEASGDWAKVKGYQGYVPFYVWIRWREGRKILVGCVFNALEIP